MAYGKNFTARAAQNTVTPQTQVTPGREEDMVVNRAGGVVFQVDAWERLRRFLVLGSDSATYYASARDMTLDNIDGLVECLRLDGLRTVREIVAVSKGGLAPKNDPALYALALASAYGVAGGAVTIKAPAKVKNERKIALALTNNNDPLAVNVRRAAFAALPDVARTGTHIMQFVGYMETVRGWGRGPRDAIANWLAHYDDERLALQAVKYRQRNDWTLRDILRLASPKIKGDARCALVDWIVHRDIKPEQVEAHEKRAVTATQNKGAPYTARRHAIRPREEIISDARARFRLIDGYHALLDIQGENAAANMIRKNSLPFELVPSELLNYKNVWDALLVNMPMTNMLRNLGKMTSIGLLAQGNRATQHVVETLKNVEMLKRARIHPFQLLVAGKVYAQGKGFKGSLVWSPVPEIVKALDEAFYLAFGNVVATNKRYMLGVDISGSMGSYNLFNSPITAREAAAAMAMITLATEDGDNIDKKNKRVHIVGFTSGGAKNWAPGEKYGAKKREAGSYRSYAGSYGSSYGVTPIPIDKSMRLDKVCDVMEAMPMGATDAALPILYAIEHNLLVDVFIIYTDNETYSGNIHVHEALRMYREKTGIHARLIACAFTATSYSVADPKDAGQMNLVGFDASAPQIISSFAMGGIGMEVKATAKHDVKPELSTDEDYTPSFNL